MFNSEHTFATGNGKAEDLKSGAMFGKYKLLGKLGEGGMGVVYKALDVELNRTVALKMLLGEESGMDKEQVERFIREARAAAKLKHPNIVSVYEFGEQGGRHFFTMDFIEGESFKDALSPEAKTRLSNTRIAEIFRDIANALNYAHSAGIVHRDIKPANILISKDGTPYLSDFGLAREMKGTEKSITVSGAVMGTPYYMSPEQASGEKRKIDARSDVFSMGAVMYEALTGKRPFDGAQLYEILDKVIQKDPPSPKSVSAVVQWDLNTICMKCLEKERHRRYQSAGELASDIRRFLDGEPINAVPSGFLTKALKRAKKNKLATGAVATAIIVLLIVLVYAMISSARTSGKIETYMEQAALEFGQGNYADARSWCDKALELSPEDASAKELQERCVAEIAKKDEKARSESEAAKAEVAEELAKKAIRAKAQAVLDRMKALTRPEEKLKACDDALKIDPAFGLAWQEKGYTHKEMEEYDNAFDCFTEAIKLEPTLAYSYYERAMITEEQRQNPEGAIPDFEKVVELDPNSHIGYYAKGCIESGKKKYDDAILSYTRAIEIYPQYYLAYNNRGNARVKKGEVDGAIADYNKAIELQPDDASAYYNRGNALGKRKGNFDGAIADFSKAIELRPDFVEAYCNRGVARDLKGDVDSAIADYNKVIELNPDDAEAYCSRGAVRDHKGDVDGAIADYNRAIELKLNNAYVYYNRAIAREKKGDFDGAIKDYEKCLELAPDQQVESNARKTIEDLKAKLKK
jgi:serine/threonine-protein kinase